MKRSGSGSATGEGEKRKRAVREAPWMRGEMSGYGERRGLEWRQMEKEKEKEKKTSVLH